MSCVAVAIKLCMQKNAENLILLVRMVLPVFFGMCSTSHFCHSHFLSESSTRNNNSHEYRNTIVLLSLSLLSEQNDTPQPLNSPLEMYHPDPMLSGSPTTQEEDLLTYLNNPNLFGDCDILQNDVGLPELSLHGFNCLPPQSCGSIFQ